jgi:hypothetical protein
MGTQKELGAGREFQRQGSVSLRGEGGRMGRAASMPSCSATFIGDDGDRSLQAADADCRGR